VIAARQVLTNDGRNRLQLRQLGGTQAPLASDDLPLLARAGDRDEAAWRWVEAWKMIVGDPA
jgi:hypothetical protein